MTNKTTPDDDWLLIMLSDTAENLEAYGFIDSKSYLPQAKAAINAKITELLVEELKSLEHSSFINTDGVRMDVVSIGTVNAHIAQLNKEVDNG
jgi:hypothetical protein